MSTSPVNDNLLQFDISTEQWREYDFIDENGKGRVYRINNPKTLFLRKIKPGEEPNFTHRVVDNTGVVHCVPSPGRKSCVLRWRAKDGQPHVSF